MAPTPGALGARAQRAAVRRVKGDTTALEQKMEELTQTVNLLVNQSKPVIRRAKKPPSQPKSQVSSSDSGSGSEYAESSDRSCDPHKARPLPPTSVAGSSPSRKSSNGSKASSKGGKPKSMRMLCFNAKLQAQKGYHRMHEDKLRITPEDFAQTNNDLAERPEVMSRHMQWSKQTGSFGRGV